MAKRKGQPEEAVNLGQNEVAVRAMIAQTKDGEHSIAQELEEGWEAEGVALVDADDNTLVVVSLNEVEMAFGAENSEDIEEDVDSPSMCDLDGEQRTAFLKKFYKDKNLLAIEACEEFGWLPSGGEMALIYAHKEEINELIDNVGGKPLSDGKYWTSQRFSNERMWSCDMRYGTFGIALGTASAAKVRPVKK